MTPSVSATTAAFAGAPRVPTKTLPQSQPTLDEYVHFHGMLCSPDTAKRCVDSFDGTILFMPHTYSPATLPSFDCTRPILTVWSYYVLVLFSLTGLSTLLGRTKFLAAHDYSVTNAEQQQQQQQVSNGVVDTDLSLRIRPSTTCVISEHDDSLVADPSVWSYVLHQSGSRALRLVRRFEYEFGFGGLSVVMLHLRCNLDKLHLVEVYRWKSALARRLFGWFSAVSHHVLRFLTAMMGRDQRLKEA